MTEADWLTSREPGKMVKFLNPQASDRKKRLVACAACRRVWHLFTDERCREAIRIAELFADGQATDEEREAGKNLAREASFDANDRDDPLNEVELAFCLLAQAAEFVAFEPSIYCALRQDTIQYDGCSALGEITQAVAVLHRLSRDEPTPPEHDNDITFHGGIIAHYAFSEGERIAQTGLLRDVFGNPFHSVALLPAWRTPTVVTLAEATYEDRELTSGALDSARLAVLADALEEAGCTDPNILLHCRQPGKHVRGCWVVDGILGKQ
jgi:hypothetical protein